MLSHTDQKGKARMVDVAAKASQKRFARASGKITLAKKTLSIVKTNLAKKGDVLTVAQIAGISAAKNTSQLIPLCHPLILEHISVDFEFCKDGMKVESRVICIGRTGVEMEALTAVSVALLTIYDMLKAVDKKMIISEISLLEKIKSDIEN